MLDIYGALERPQCSRRIALFDLCHCAPEPGHIKASCFGDPLPTSSQVSSSLANVHDLRPTEHHSSLAHSWPWGQPGGGPGKWRTSLCPKLSALPRPPVTLPQHLLWEFVLLCYKWRRGEGGNGLGEGGQHSQFCCFVVNPKGGDWPHLLVEAFR